MLKTNKYMKAYLKTVQPKDSSNVIKEDEEQLNDYQLLKKYFEQATKLVEDDYGNWGELIVAMPGEEGWGIDMYWPPECPNEENFINPSACVSIIADYIANKLDSGEIEATPQDIDAMSEIHHYYEYDAEEDCKFLTEMGVDQQLSELAYDGFTFELADGSQDDGEYSYLWNTARVSI